MEVGVSLRWGFIVGRGSRGTPGRPGLGRWSPNAALGLAIAIGQFSGERSAPRQSFCLARCVPQLRRASMRNVGPASGAGCPCRQQPWTCAVDWAAGLEYGTHGRVMLAQGDLVVYRVVERLTLPSWNRSFLTRHTCARWSVASTRHGRRGSAAGDAVFEYTTLGPDRLRDAIGQSEVSMIHINAGFECPCPAVACPAADTLPHMIVTAAGSGPYRQKKPSRPLPGPGKTRPVSCAPMTREESAAEKHPKPSLLSVADVR